MLRIPLRALLRGCGGLTALALVVAAAGAGAEELRTRRLQSLPADLGVVRDEFVVEFRREVAHRLEALPVQAAGRARANLPEVQALLDRVLAQRFERQFVSARPEPQGGKHPDLTGYYLVRLPAGSDLDAAMREFARHPEVDHVEPIGIHGIDLTPNDPYYLYGTTTTPYDQWHLHDMRGGVTHTAYSIDADLAWNINAGSPNVLVGILDTGVKYRHNDLGGANPPGPADNDTQGNVWVSPFEIPGNGVDDELNGFVDDVIGYDFVDAPIPVGGWTAADADVGLEDNDPNDGEGHGTHLAGTVSAITNNARAVAGIAGGYSNGTTGGAGNGVKVVALRIGHRIVNNLTLAESGVVTMANAAQAMAYLGTLVDRGLNVAAVNCSWQSSNTGGIAAAVASLQSRDVLVVSAAGNQNLTTSAANGQYLATLANVLTIGATDSLGAGAYFSNYGALVDLAAPGVDVISTAHEPLDPDTTHMYIGISSGTSMAAPHVCGVAALLEAYNPQLSALDKASLMMNHVTPFGPTNTKQLGTGILNARLALLATPTNVGVGDVPGGGRRMQLSASPNPARSGAELRVGAAAGEALRVQVLDSSGRRVRSLDGVADATGILRVRWDGKSEAGRRAAAGLYFVTASGTSGSVSRRLVVLE